VYFALIKEAIRDIEHHPRGQLFQRFLTHGPYWASGAIPAADADKYLPDADVAASVDT
jgi:hypothetical protein